MVARDRTGARYRHARRRLESQQVAVLDGIGLPSDLTGLRALDIGCSDGYFSFELERRGATVVAVDFVPEDYTGFATARKILGSSAEYRMIPRRGGTMTRSGCGGNSGEVAAAIVKRVSGEPGGRTRRR